jgi:hypothetical protein
MDAMVECFPTHAMVNEFIESIAKQDSKSVTIVIYREEEHQPVECHLQFPLLQRNRFKALCLYAVCMSYAGWEYMLPTLTLDKLRPFLQMVVMIATGKSVTDIPEMGILLLSVVGSSNMADTYSSWKDKFVDFLGSYRSCYTGALLQYLVCKDDDTKQEEMETFAPTKQFLVNAMSYESSVNLAFSDENQALASCLAKALGLATKETSDILALTSKGFGHLAWVKLHDRIMGLAKASPCTSG